MKYPVRDPFFAHRFVRLLQKSCAAMEIGQNACLLLCYIAHTEDAMRYSGPVKFWNEQLLTTMGFKSPKQLNDCRQKAIKAGWLTYDRAGHREVGKYWVTIPAEFEDMQDTVIEPILSEYGMNNGMNNGTNRERIAERIGDGLRNEFGTESGKPSIPNPIPIPKTKQIKKTGSQDDPEFERFWLAYPRKTAKGNARKAWVAATKKADPEAIIAAAGRYAKTVTDPKYTAHPASWLNAERWLDEESQPTKKPRLPNFETPEGMAELERLFAEGLHT